jgi:hypothetical protein
MASALQKTAIKRTPTTVELVFDSDMFGGAENLARVMDAVGKLGK